MNQKKNVLICPLNWGLGHASRVVPIISTLLKQNFEVIIAASGSSADFLQSEFPQLKCIEFPGYTVRYSKRRSQLLKMGRLAPVILCWSFKEHRALRNLVIKHHIHIVISDQRFGCWSKLTYNIFITHQIRVKFPSVFRFLEPVYQFLSESFMQRYDECWIPDYKNGNSLSGELSHTTTGLKNISFIGPLSRFNKSYSSENQKKIDILFLLSGPEPQRNMLENIIYEQTKKLSLKMVMVRGSNSRRKQHFHFPTYNVLNTKQLGDIITQSKLIVCRSGYSSIMDLIALQQKAVLIPTPGQTEQEYLAQYHSDNKIFYSVSQTKFDIKDAMEKVFDFPINVFNPENTLNNKIIDLRNIK